MSQENEHRLLFRDAMASLFADAKPDRVVNAMLYNYQGYDHTNSGQIRMLTFDTATRNLHVFTYSPFTKRYYRDDFFKSLEFDLKDAF